MLFKAISFVYQIHYTYSSSHVVIVPHSKLYHLNCYLSPRSVMVRDNFYWPLSMNSTVALTLLLQ